MKQREILDKLEGRVIKSAYFTDYVNGFYTDPVIKLETHDGLKFLLSGAGGKFYDGEPGLKIELSE